MKINQFARHNAKWEELKDDLKAKQNTLQNLEDASDELLMTEDESAPIPYVAGEAFIHLTLDETKERLEEAKGKLKGEIHALEVEGERLKGIMSDLKTQLYAKFGSNINLEAEEE
uniref:EOG090X0JBP n=1 Tax=Lynceus sp. MCZ IZ 141354 TaxID=1930659 RepID=A0A9N6WRS5_9CRUS|nr:EOG090X0JBP [Lynceus sp. MCZ IZ 141354]